MAKTVQISKNGWLKMLGQDHTPSYFMNLNQYETIRKGELPIEETKDDKPFYIEFVRPGEQTGVRITFPTREDRDEVFNGLVDAL